MDPKVKDSKSIAGSMSVNGSNVDYRFREPIPAVTYIVQQSTNLVNWTTYTGTPVQDGSDLKVTVPASDSKYFFRLKLQE